MEKVNVKIFNNSENPLPVYSTPQSAGMDLYADVLEISKRGTKGSKYLYSEGHNHVILKPGGRVLIPTNNHIKLPDGYEWGIRPRSGLAIKKGITVLNTPGTIDSDYTGNVGVILLNTDDKEDFVIKQGDRIAQAVLNKVGQIEWEQVGSLDELGKTDRGQGGFGHTGV